MGGLSFEEYSEWRNEITDRLKRRCDDNVNLTVINPPEFFNFEMDVSSYTNTEIYEFEMRAVRESDFIIANLNYNDSIGTSHELAVACENRIPVIALVDDKKVSSIHPFDLECVSKICNTMDDLVDYISYYYLV